MPAIATTTGCRGAWNVFESYSAHHARLAGTQVQSVGSQDTRRFLRVVLAVILFMGLAAGASAEPERPSRFTSYAIYGLAHGADFASTEVALARGGREANPMPGMQSRGGRIGWKALSWVGMSELDHLLVRRNKRKAAWGVRIGMLALAGYAVKNNLGVR